MNIQIRNAHTSDCASIATLHKELLPTSFLGRLSGRFLDLLYTELLCSNNGIVIVGEEQGRIVGFITGTVNTSQFYKYFLKRNFLSAGLLLLPYIIKKDVSTRIFETFTYGKKATSASLPEAELLSMAVGETYQGRGVGQELFAHLVEEYRRRGVNCFKVVVGDTLERANKFYLKVGCRKRGEYEVHRGEKSNVYVFEG